MLCNRLLNIGKLLYLSLGNGVKLSNKNNWILCGKSVFNQKLLKRGQSLFAEGNLMGGWGAWEVNF